MGDQHKKAPAWRQAGAGGQETAAASGTTLHKRRRGRWIIMGAIALVAVLGAVFMYTSWKADEGMRFAQKIGAGWNLGNSLDSHSLHFDSTDPLDYETYWGNPETTKQVMLDIKAAGFSTVRIPVTWFEHMDENHQVDAAWMNRVQEVVDYAFDAGLYVILNTHHENWHTPTPDNLARADKMMGVLWTQIAQHFAAYDEKLLFEGMNEPRLLDSELEWTDGTPEARQAVNRLNATFVQAVRAASGHNAQRYLLLPTFCARITTDVLESFCLPEGENRVIVSVHIYPQQTHAATDDLSMYDGIFAELERLFVSQKTPVVITEFGIRTEAGAEVMKNYAQYMAQKARALGMGYIWWDNGAPPDAERSYSIYDRSSNTWLYPEVLRELTGN